MYTFYNAFNTMKNEMQTIASSNSILKEAATAGLTVLDEFWYKYIDDNFHTVIKYLLFGKDAIVEAAQTQTAQKWLFKWALLYFKGMSIQFKS